MTDFSTNVFLNCPFDRKYLEMLRPLLFTVIRLGFRPRIASEALDSGSPRVTKIISLIEQSKYAIHDLSRIEAMKKGEIFRLNMPFELGLDVGCRLFKSGKWSEKRCLILEEKPYRYQAALSDLSNSDIAVHKGEPEEIVACVRNWINNEARLRADGPSKIWGDFLDFMSQNYDELKSRGFSDSQIENLPVPELISNIDDWCNKAK